MVFISHTRYLTALTKYINNKQPRSQLICIFDCDAYLCYSSNWDLVFPFYKLLMSRLISDFHNLNKNALLKPEVVKHSAWM